MLRRFASGCFASGIVCLIGCCQLFSQGLSPTTPAQEYIRLNGQVIAIENGSNSTLPFGVIDAPGAGNNNQPLSGSVTLSGFALSTVSAIGSVAVSIDGQTVGNAAYGNNRPDACQAYPGAVGCPAADVGWTYTLNTVTLANGPHTFTVTFNDSSTPPLTGSVTTSFGISNQASTLPFGAIDTPGAGNNNQALTGSSSIGGWALSDVSAISSAVVSVDGQTIGNATYGNSRPDVCQVFPSAAGCPAANVGWSYTLNTAAFSNGSHLLTIAITDSSTPALTSAITNSFAVSNQIVAGAPVADEFDGTSVNTSLWSKQDAIGDGTLSESGGELHIVVPGGTVHDPYTSGNTGVEVMQSIANADFQVEAKFDSASPATGEQGLMAMQDTSTYVRCDLNGDGTNVNTYSAFLSGTTVSNAVYSGYSIASSYWLRLSRQGNTWTCSVSIDGTNFSQVNQFTQAMTVTQVGPWAGNQGTAFTSLVDYFRR